MVHMHLLSAATGSHLDIILHRSRRKQALFLATRARGTKMSLTRMKGANPTFPEEEGPPWKQTQRRQRELEGER